jgi:hypothetical protein
MRGFPPGLPVVDNGLWPSIEFIFPSFINYLVSFQILILIPDRGTYMGNVHDLHTCLDRYDMPEI